MGELRTGNALTQLLHQNAHIIEQLALRGLDRVVTTIVPLELEVIGQESQLAHTALPPTYNTIVDVVAPSAKPLAQVHNGQLQSVVEE